MFGRVAIPQIELPQIKILLPDSSGGWKVRLVIQVELVSGEFLRKICPSSTVLFKLLHSLITLYYKILMLILEGIMLYI